jgi:hypothetical protein
VPVEKPRAVRKMAELLYGEPPDYRRLAGDLQLPVALIRSVLDGSATLNELPRIGPVPEPEPDAREDDVSLPDNVRDLNAHRERQIRLLE